MIMADINSRMSAWKQATASPERTSEFLKAGGGYDLSDIAKMINVVHRDNFNKEIEDSKAREMSEWDTAGKYYSDFKSPEAQADDLEAIIRDNEWLTDAERDAVSKYLRRLSKEERGRIAAELKGKTSEFHNGTLKDIVTPAYEAGKRLHYLPGAENDDAAKAMISVYTDDLPDGPLPAKAKEALDGLRENFTDVVKMGDKAAARENFTPKDLDELHDLSPAQMHQALRKQPAKKDFEDRIGAERIPNAGNFHSYYDEDTGERKIDKTTDTEKKLNEFKESATLLDGYLEGLQDHGYITRSQKEFAKAYYKPTPEETAQVRTGGRISMDPDGMRLYNSDGVMTYGPEITAQREAEDAAIRRRGRTPITSSSPNLTDKTRRYLKRKEEAESKRPFTGKLPAQQQQQSQQPAGKEPFTGKMPAQQPAGEKPFTGKMPYTGKEPFAESEDFAKSPTYSYDSYTAANAPIDKLIGASMNAQRQIYDRGKDPKKAMMDEVPVELRGNTGPGKLGFSKEPFGAVVVDVRKDAGQPLSPDNTKKYQVTMSGAKASQDRFNKKKAEEQQAAEEQTADGVDPLFGEIAPRSAAAEEQPVKEESPVDERYAALLAKYQ